MDTSTTPGTTEQSHHQLPSLKDAGRLMVNLRASMAHHELVEGKQLSPLIATLSAWQSVRLSRTHADMLADPQFGQAGAFFLDGIYAPKDFTQRDDDGQRVYHFMNRFLPEATLHPLAMALEVNSLMQQLDLALAEAMRSHLGVDTWFERWQYEEAYRLCDNYEVRARQIDLIVEVGHQLERVRRVPFVHTTLRLRAGRRCVLAGTRCRIFWSVGSRRGDCCASRGYFCSVSGSVSGRSRTGSTAGRRCTGQQSVPGQRWWSGGDRVAGFTASVSWHLTKQALLLILP